MSPANELLCAQLINTMYDYQQPDPTGHFGIYGGSFVSETLTHALDELKAAYAKYQHDPAFLKEFHYELKHFVGRPSPIYHAARTAATNWLIFSRLLIPLEISTPELTSTASVLQRGLTCKMPSVTFAGVSPPDKTR